LLAVTGALVLLVAETAGEVALGIDREQTQLTRLFAIYTVAGAPVLEELIFRGWLVVDGRGERMMWASAVGASLVFALIHPFLWQWDESGFVLTLGVKGWFSTLVVFAMSLWLYIARLATWNPTRSLLPCFAAHAAKNAGVVAIKAASGYIGAWW
jgi:uncharacterized protein